MRTARDYRAGVHLRHLTVHEYAPAHAQAILNAGTVGADVVQLAAPQHQGLAYTLRSPRGAVVGMGGYVEFWPGSGEFWALASMHAERYARDVLTFARWVVEMVEGESGAKRMQAHVADGHPRAVRFLEHLGFTYEHTSPRFLPGGIDAHCYVRLP